MAMTSKIKGRKRCIDCGELFEFRSCKKERCDKCAQERRRKQARMAYSPDGSKIGYNQKGENNNNYVNGLGTYRQYRGTKCERCGSTLYLCVHHRDRNRQNNNPENLETLCKRCHQKEHEVYRNFTKGIVRSSENKESEE